MNIWVDYEIRDLIKNSGRVILASYIGGAVLFIANAALASLFKPVGFGVFKTVISLFSFLPAVIDFGISVTFIKYIACSPKEDIKVIIEQFLKILAYFYFFCALAMLIFIRPLAFYFLKDNSLGIMFYAGLALFIFYYFEIFKSIIQGFQAFKLYAVSQLLTFCSIGIFSFILGYYFGIYYGILGWGLGYFLGNLVNLRFLAKSDVFAGKGAQPDIGKIFFGYSLPMHFTALPVIMGLAVIPVLSPFFTQKLIGYLAFSMVFYQLVINIPTTLAIVLFPKFSQASASLTGPGNLLKKALRLYTPFVVIGIILCLIFMRIFLKILFPVYLPAAAICTSLICLSFIGGYLIIYRTYLSAVGRFKRLMFINSIYVILLFLVSFAGLYLMSH